MARTTEPRKCPRTGLPFRECVCWTFSTPGKDAPPLTEAQRGYCRDYADKNRRNHETL